MRSLLLVSNAVHMRYFHYACITTKITQCVSTTLSLFYECSRGPSGLCSRRRSCGIGDGDIGDGGIWEDGIWISELGNVIWSGIIARRLTDQIELARVDVPKRPALYMPGVQLVSGEPVVKELERVSCLSDKPISARGHYRK